MADQIQCPHCGRSIAPVNKWVSVWEKGVLKRNTIFWIVSAVIGLLMIALGIFGIIHFGLSSPGLVGASAVILGACIAGSLVLRYVRIARKKERRQVCPLCKHQWVGQINGAGAAEVLESYFTDVEHLRNEFRELTSAPNLQRRLLIIHGVGGVGKSSLFRMFRLHCRKQGVPVAFSSGDEAKSLVDVLSDWAKDLVQQGIALPVFVRTMNEYRGIQRKVEERAKMEQKSQSDSSKHAIKIAVQTAGSIAGFIPLVGPALSMAMGGAGDTLVDWLHGFLNKQEIDLLLDPTEELTEGFLTDLADAISKATQTSSIHRVVLLLDTFEQLAALSRWACNLAQRLPPDVLLVLGGRRVPTWEQQWPGWSTQAMIEELKPMTAEVMRELVYRYYATQRGGKPDPAQVEAIIHFARGLPIAVTAIVQLWVQYGVEDFQAVRAQVVADLVDQLTRGIPERVRPVLKAAATLRWFNQELLSVVTGEQAFSDTVYEELRRFPFVRPRKEGLALHDSVREHLDDNLRVHEPNRHREMHQRAATYFEEQVRQIKGDVATDVALEALYHKIMAYEDEGIKQYRKTAEELVSYQLLNQLRTLLNDVNNHPLKKENNRLWREYYRARLRDLEGRRADALPLYHAIADDMRAEDILRAYALSDIVWATGRADIEHKAQLLERIRILCPEPEILPELDAKLSFYLIEVSELYQEQGKCDEALIYLERAQRLYERMDNLYWLAFTHNQKKYFYLNRGMWQESRKEQERGLQKLKKLTGEQQQSYLEAELLAGVSIGWMWAGRYNETEKNLRNALRMTEQFGRVQQRIYFLRDLAFVLGLQGKIQEAQKYFIEGIEPGRQQDPLFEAILQGFQGIVALRWEGIEQGEQLLAACMDGLKEHPSSEWDALTFLHFYGTFYEMSGQLDLAEQKYSECLAMRQFERWYLHAGALTGLVRVNYGRGEFEALADLQQEAETLAHQYEFSDHLASLLVVKGHMAWDDQEADVEQRIEAARNFYQQALIYALRYNRFLLDEVLSGQPHGTPLQPIIPHCLKRGKEGQRMLQLLYDWWKSGLNVLDTSRPSTVSTIPEGILLVEGERLARREEPGNRMLQATVMEQLDKYL